MESGVVIDTCPIHTTIYYSIMYVVSGYSIPSTSIVIPSQTLFISVSAVLFYANNYTTHSFLLTTRECFLTDCQ